MGSTRVSLVLWPLVVAGGMLGCNAVLGLEPSTLVLDGSTGSTGGDANDATVRDSNGSGDDDGHPSGSSGGSGEGGGVPGADAGDSGCPGECAPGTTQCGGGGVQTCQMQPNGCGAWSMTSLCAAGLVCERYEGAVCLDPIWAQWPIPNDPGDGVSGAGRLQAYTDNHDGTVSDDVTGLVWQQTAPTSNNFTQSASMNYCKTLTLGGYHDWRLPSMIELISLIDFGRASPCIDTDYFPGAPANAFWSSTPAANSTLLAWGVTFLYGEVGTNTVGFPASVRCVR
jgi:hypothetical protein